jgi:outer membrane protein assembly factor BamB
LGVPPAVVSGQVLVPEGSSLVALDLSTGTRIWDMPVGGPIVAPITAAQGIVFATTADGTLHAIELANRRERWSFAGAAEGAQVTVVDGTVYAGTRSRDFVALDLSTGMRIWAVPIGHASEKNAIADGVAFVGGDGDSTLTAISLSRRTILWTFDTQGDRLATPVVVGRTLFVAGIPFDGLSGRNTNLFALDMASGAVMWRFRSPQDQPMASFAVGDEDVFIGLDAAPGTLYAVGRDTGTVRWQAAVDGAVDRPVVVGGFVYVAAGPGGLHAYDIASGRPQWSAFVDGYSEGVIVTGGIALVASREAPDAPGLLTAFVDPTDTRAAGTPRRAGLDLKNGTVSLFHHVQLHQHSAECHPSSEPDV